MTVRLTILIATIMLSQMTSTVSAQRNAADRADRGQRLDSDAFRNDFLQEQLSKPTAPPLPQTAPSTKSGEKPKSTKR